jgi:hypothetical protein
VALAVAMAVAAGVAFVVGPTTAGGGLLLNLTTEIAGILVTVLVIDVLVARRRREDEIRRLAWDLLHELDHAVRVWQGGRREPSVAELMALVSRIGAEDPVPWFTQNLFMRIGSRSAALRDLRPELVRASHELATALEALVPLASMRDGRACLPPERIKECIAEGVRPLLTILRQTRSERTPGAACPTGAPRRDPLEKSQEWRHFGDRPAASVADEASHTIGAGGGAGAGGR